MYYQICLYFGILTFVLEFVCLFAHFLGNYLSESQSCIQDMSSFPLTSVEKLNYKQCGLFLSLNRICLILANQPAPTHVSTFPSQKNTKTYNLLIVCFIKYHTYQFFCVCSFAVTKRQLHTRENCIYSAYFLCNKIPNLLKLLTGCAVFIILLPLVCRVLQAPHIF